MKKFRENNNSDELSEKNVSNQDHLWAIFRENDNRFDRMAREENYFLSGVKS